MSTEPTAGLQEEGQAPDPNKVAEAEKLFDKLFGKSEPAKIVSAPPSIPPAVVKGNEVGETFTRKIVVDDDKTVPIPGAFLHTDKEVAVPPPIQKAVETSSIKTSSGTQDIPTAVDAVTSETVKAQLLAKAKAAKNAAMPEIDVPARVNNIKSQHQQLRARLEYLERQE